MDKRLLFSAILATAIGANEAKAQKVSAPTLSEPIELKLDGTDTVYIYNVKAQKWIVNGNGWDTQTSLSDKGMPIAIVPNKTNKVPNGTYSFYNKGKSQSAWGSRIFYSGTDDYGGTSYVDYNNQGVEKCNWEIWKKEGGKSFEIQADTIANSSETSNTRAGWNPYDPKIDGQGAVAKDEIFRPVLNLSADGASDFGIEWQAYTEEAYNAYALRLELMTAINDAVDEGLDVSKSIAVYNNSNATSEELKAATQYISDIRRNMTMTDATASDPKDITEFMNNANCDALTGWTREGVFDANGNKGSGGHGTNWQLQSASYTSEDNKFTTTKFIERWIDSSSNPETNDAANTGHLSDSQLSQKLTNLPKGGYKLSCWAMATHQGKGDSYQVEGVSLFANTGSGSENSMPVATKARKPQHFEFMLDIQDNDDLTVGFKLNNATANWVFVDEFKLEYYGESAQAMYLADVKSAASDLVDWIGGEAANSCQDYVEKANKLAEEANAMDENTSKEDILAKKAEIVAINSTIQESLDLYASLAALYDTIEEFLAEDGANPTDALNNLMDDSGDGVSLEDLLTTYSLDNGGLKKYMVALNEALAASKYQSIKPGADVTYKITNPSFENGTTGWSGAETPSSDYQNCEAYQKTFDMYQDIEGLPEGVYEVSMQGMARMTWNAETKTAHDNGSEVINAVLYANELTTKFASPFSAYTTEKADNEYSYEENGETRYVPNSMKGFMAACAADENNYKVTIPVYVYADGKLRIGVKETALPSTGGSWCIWDNFKLQFKGGDAEAISTVSAPLLEKAKALLNSKMNADSLAVLKNAIESLENGGTKVELKACALAVTAAESSIAAYEPLNAAIENAKTRYAENEDAGENSAEAKAIYAAALNNATDAYNNGSVADAEIAAAVVALNAGFTQYVIHDAAKVATASNPVDVSKVIVNNAFATMDATGWTVKAGDIGFQSSNNVEAAEFYNCAFNLEQQIYGLPAGTYYLTSQAFYRNGNNASAYVDADETTFKYDVNENAFLFFANAAPENVEDAQTVPFKTITACPVEEANLNEYVSMGSTSGLVEFGGAYIPNTMSTAQSFFKSEQVGPSYVSDPIKIEYDGKGNFIIGAIKTTKESADWTIIKNFKLTFAGVDPTGINETVADGDVVATKIYTTDGVQVGKLQKGVNIVETTMKDGSKKVKKVVVK